MTLLGEPVQYGWRRMLLAKKIHDSVGTASEFAVYPGVGHSYSDEIMADLKDFFEQYRLTDTPLMPVPERPRIVEQRSSVFTYKSREPSRARPLGVGPIASGGDTVNLSVALHGFSAPVDVYFAVSVPWDSNIFLVGPDYRALPVTQRPIPWKTGVTEKIEEGITGDIRAGTLPSGRYNLYLVVTPQGSLDGYYLWSTYFVIP
ncbi:MAG TPA: hypothetical protein VN260_09110 [Dissulfurispiraceae bacterium]|nr:hypothetical protein [Dissulfurispiraceae bacterium]